MGCEPADTPARLAARVDRLFLPGFGDEEAGPKEHAEGFGAALELHDLSSGEERAFSESEREAGTRDGALGSGNGEACHRGRESTGRLQDGASRGDGHQPPADLPSFLASPSFTLLVQPR